MDSVVNLVFGKEPHLITPFLRVSIRILCVIVVDQVRVSDVSVERWVKGRVRQKFGQGHCDEVVVGTLFWKRCGCKKSGFVLCASGWIYFLLSVSWTGFCLVENAVA